MQQKIILILAVICVIFAATTTIAFVLLFNRASMSESVQPIISSFAECAEAGYPIAESYPEQCRTPDGTVFVNTVVATKTPTTTDPAMCDPVLVLSHQENGLIGSPAVVKGTARGYWFFEASMPLQLVDGNNNVVTTTIVQADGEWMTEECVPFTATLEFDVPPTQYGLLRFKKDNPSGEPQYDAEYEFPVQFWQQML